MAHGNHHNAQHEGSESALHETREFDARLIIFSGIGLTVVVVVVLGIIWGTIKIFEKTLQPTERVGALAPLSQIPPNPRLQEKPYVELQQLRIRENRILSTYGWVDQKAGTVHIPISKAMETVVQQGLPTRGSADAGNTAAGAGSKARSANKSGAPQAAVTQPQTARQHAESSY